MSNPKFKKGDVVVLKSGSPEMTIEKSIEYSTDWQGNKKLLEEPKYEVIWYNETLKQHIRERFSESVLELSEE